MCIALVFYLRLLSSVVGLWVGCFAVCLLFACGFLWVIGLVDYRFGWFSCLLWGAS